MPQKLIIENRSTWSLDDVHLRVGEVLQEWGIMSPESNTTSLAWEDGFILSIFRNKHSVRVVAHKNDGVDHQQED